MDTGVLKEILLKMSKRVLILDMNARREAGELSGDSEEEEYADYVYRHLMQPEYLENLFREYPVWEEVIFQGIEFYIRNVNEIIQHLDSESKGFKC